MGGNHQHTLNSYLKPASYRRDDPLRLLDLLDPPPELLRDEPPLLLLPLRELPLELLDLDEELLRLFTVPELRPVDLLLLLLVLVRGRTVLLLLVRVLELESLRRRLSTVPLRDRLDSRLDPDSLPVEFQTRVLRLRGCTVLVVPDLRLRLFCTPLLLLELLPVLRLLPTVVEVLLVPRVPDEPLTREVPRQSSLLRELRVTGTSPARCPSPAAVWRLRVASVAVPRLVPLELPVSRIRKPPWLRPVLDDCTKELWLRLAGSAPR